MIMAFLLLWLIDKRMYIILDQYIDFEVERLTNNIINKEINEKITEKDLRDLFIIEEKEEARISYNTKKLNNIKNEITTYIQDVLINLDDGKVDNYFIPNRIKTGRFKKIKNGIICDVSIGSLRGSTIFANIGPSIPMKLIFTGQIKSDINIKVKEYGINNAMIEIDLIMEIQEQVSMPVTSKKKTIKIKSPLTIDIVKGKIPSYYGGVLK